MGKHPQPRLQIDALTGQWRNGEAGGGRGSEPCEPGGLQLGPGGGDITWPDQAAPRWRKASSTRKIKPQTSNPIRRARLAALKVHRSPPLED